MRLGDSAYQALRRSIIDGSLSMGEQLVETHIAEELRMSRAPVREAIKRLAVEGLVVQEPHLRARVLDLTAEDIADLHNVRLGLETTALRLFLARDGSTEPLRAHIAEMKAAAKEGDVDAVVTAELAWHRHINEGSGNRLLVRMFEDFEGRVVLAASLEDRIMNGPSGDGSSSTHLDFVVREHEAIVDAIDEGRHDAAVMLFEQHFASTVPALLERLGGDVSSLLGPMSGTPVSD